MRVVFVLPALTAGGAERVLITLMNGIDRSRFDPALVSVSAQGSMKSLVAPGIPVHILTQKGRVGRSLPRLYLKLRALNPDIVVSTMAHMNFGALLLKPFFPRTLFIVREAITPSFILQDRGLAEPLIRFLYRFLYPKAALVISPAQIIVDEFRSVLGMKTDNHAVLPNPVDIEKIRAGALPPRQDKSVRFVAAGRLHGQKGFDRLIAALPSLPAAMHWSLTILGEGPERGSLEKQVDSLGLKGKVSLPGLIETPWPHYAAADAFLLPSRWEGLPNVVLEALACGTPVIATAESGGISEIAARSKSVTVVENMDSFMTAMAGIKADPVKNFRLSLLPDSYLPDNIVRQFTTLLETAGPETGKTLKEELPAGL